MDKAIERHLVRRGVHTTAPFKDSMPFSERAPKFFEWFHHSVLNLDTEEYRKAFWREVKRTGRTIGPVPYTLDDYLRRRGTAYRQDMVNLIAYALLMGGSFAAWVIRRQIDRHIRRLKRPGYYDRELARRKQLAEDRRRLKKRRTLNSCPTDEELRERFAMAKDSPADMIRFGSLLEDLECHVDNSAIFDERGNIVGRRGGIRQYLRDNVPELSAHYKTVMRYKALAKRFRQALGVSDPVPAAMLLPDKVKTDKVGGRAGIRARRRNVLRPGSNANQEKTIRREFASELNLVEARAEAEKLFSGCENTCVSLMAALAIRTNPDYAPRVEGGMQSLVAQMAEARLRMGKTRGDRARGRHDRTKCHNTA